jgi:hypothetical protein
VFRCSLDGERCRFVAFNFGSVNAVEFATASNDALWVGSERGTFVFVCLTNRSLVWHKQLTATAQVSSS